MSVKSAKSIVVGAALFIVLAVVLCGSFAAGFEFQRQRRAHQSAEAGPFSVFWEAWDLVERYFYGGPPSPQARTYGAIRGALASLNDPYTTIITDTAALSPTVTARTILTANVGYIAIAELGPRTGAEFQAAVEEFAAAPVKAVILDLRGTGGGYLTATQTILDSFLDGGTAFYAVYRDGREQMFTCEPGGAMTALPVAVLLSEDTGGGAEAVAGTLRERGRATLVGAVTAGDGTAQAAYRLSDGSTLYLTVAALLTSAHHAVHNVGVTPDVAVKPDDALAIALDILKE